MLKVIYDPELHYDGGRGGLRVFCPDGERWINYNFVHSVVPERNADIWRMSVVNACDEKGQALYQLTNDSAEWEMAIRLAGRPDFIGGFNHGDEVYDEIRLYLDGERTAPESLTEERVCGHMRLVVRSTGFDPSAPDRAVLRHVKDFLVDDQGVHLQQEVNWLNEEQLDTRFYSYLAMMPPLKHGKDDPDRILTDSYAFGDGMLAPVARLPVEKEDTRAITVRGGEGSFAFKMSAEDYSPRYVNSYFAFLTDNGGVNYNKMYIVFAGGSGEVIPAGTVWRAKTHYSVKKA